MNKLQQCIKHRKMLLSNPNKYTQDIDRAKMRFAQTAYKSVGRQGSNKKKLIPLFGELAQLVIEAQGNTPLYDYKDPLDILPRAWNSPMNMDLDYVKYEIGHLTSINNGGSFKPENLSFQSARCNQHIQSSLNFDETTEYRKVEEVTTRVENLFELHKSKKWLDIKKEINSIVR